MLRGGMIHVEARGMAKTALMKKESGSLGTIWMPATEDKGRDKGSSDFHHLSFWCETYFRQKLMFGDVQLEELRGIADARLQ